VEEARVELDELSGVPLFADLEPRSLAMLVREARVEAAPARTCLFKEGKKPEMLHVLLAGSVQLSAAFAREARETVIEVASAPDCFILAAVLTDTPYLMSATVLEPARLLLLPAAGFRRDIASNPDLSLILLASLACQSRRMVRQLKNLKLRSTVQRLGCFLLTLSKPAPDDTAVVTLPYDKQLIASQLGMTRESLSRALAVLRDFGVETRSGQVLLKDPVALAKHCGSDALIDEAERDLRFPKPH